MERGKVLPFAQAFSSPSVLTWHVGGHGSPDNYRLCCGESQFLLHCGFHSSEEWVGGKTEDHPPNRLQAVP